MSVSATEHKKAEHEAASPSQTINEVFHETVRGLETALKSGIELQEQSIQFWSDLLSKTTTAEQFQNKLGGLNLDLLPALRRQMEEGLHAMNLSSTQATNLLRKSAGLLQATSIPDAQRRLQEYMESLLGTARLNIQLSINTTSRAISFFSDSAMRATRAAE